jgi:hypothetical protein
MTATPQRNPSRALRLLQSDPLPALPTAQDLLSLQAPRRPGELHEALPLPEGSAQAIATQAADAGVGLDVAASLVLEAGLIADDTRMSSWGQGRQSNHEALALPEASARYLRALTVGRKRSGAAVLPRGSVAVPVRLVPRLAAASIGHLIGAIELEVAITWEVAAVRQGRTMSEWALMQTQTRV